MPDIPFTKPLLPELDELQADFSKLLETGMMTNSQFVKKFEEGMREYIGVQHAVAVSSCTSGLMLAAKALRLTGEVILPSFTFTATGSALLWNNLRLIFADIHPERLTLDPDQVNERISDKTSAIVAVHTFGNPADVTALQEIADDNGLPLLFDAAHGIGASFGDKKIGSFGTAEVFSLSPTKLIACGEGGIVATNNKKLADTIRLARNYGITDSYDCLALGLNARMQEVSALFGLSGLRRLATAVQRRNELVSRYLDGLDSLPGISFQKKHAESVHAYKDFYTRIDASVFGCSRDAAYEYLKKKGISCKKYFDPPLHLQRLFKPYLLPHQKLPATEQAAHESLCLPLFSGMSNHEADTVVQALKELHETVAPAVTRKVSK